MTVLVRLNLWLERLELGVSGTAGMERKPDRLLSGGRVAIADSGQLPTFPKRMLFQEC